MFVVYKASLDGISGGEATYSLEEVLRELWDSKGWDSRQHMLAGIQQWAAKAQPGNSFKTRSSVVVCVSSHGQVYCTCPECDAAEENIDWGDLSPVESGNVEQKGECLICEARWMDVWTPSERRELFRRKAAATR